MTLRESCLTLSFHEPVTVEQVFFASMTLPVTLACFTPYSFFNTQLKDLLLLEAFFIISSFVPGVCFVCLFCFFKLQVKVVRCGLFPQDMPRDPRCSHAAQPMWRGAKKCFESGMAIRNDQNMTGKFISVYLSSIKSFSFKEGRGLYGCKELANSRHVNYSGEEVGKIKSLLVQCQCTVAFGVKKSDFKIIAVMKSFRELGQYSMSTSFFSSLWATVSSLP